MKISISYGWSELSDDAKEEMIERVKVEYLEAAEAEGKVFMTQPWHDPQPKTWQEAYCRQYAIESIMWDEYERNEPDAEVITMDDWKYWLEDHIEKEAVNKLYDAFKYSEAEVEL